MKWAVMWLTILLVASFSAIIFAHEAAHVEIYRHYGIDSNITWFYIEENASWWTMTSVTIAEETCPTAECTLAQNLNEVFGYHISMAMMVIAVFLYIIAIILIGKYEKDEEWKKREEMNWVVASYNG